MSGNEDLFGRPPFAIVRSLEPAQVADEIVSCFDRLGSRPDALEHAHALAMRTVPLAQDTALYRAGHAIARDVDRGIGAGQPDGYHNGRHFLEVALCALYLCQDVGLGQSRTARVVTAALIHDFHHDGSRSGVHPFRLEALAAREASRYLRGEGVARELELALEALVLATEPKHGVPFARACVAHHTHGISAPSGAGLPEPLMSLLGDAELARDAVLLAEADVLPSIGLTVAHSAELQARIAREWKAALGSADKLAFVDRVADELMFARFFVPNIDALRHAYRAGDMQDQARRALRR